MCLTIPKGAASSILTSPRWIVIWRIRAFFFCTTTPTTEIYTLSLHDALPIRTAGPYDGDPTWYPENDEPWTLLSRADADRKSTRLNSSHLVISYAVFCLK